MHVEVGVGKAIVCIVSMGKYGITVIFTSTTLSDYDLDGFIFDSTAEAHVPESLN